MGVNTYRLSTISMTEQTDAESEDNTPMPDLAKQTSKKKVSGVVLRKNEQTDAESEDNTPMPDLAKQTSKKKVSGVVLRKNEQTNDYEHPLMPLAKRTKKAVVQDLADANTFGEDFADADTFGKDLADANTFVADAASTELLEDDMPEMDFPAMLPGKLMTVHETAKQKKLTDVHSKTQKKSVKKNMQPTSLSNDLTSYNFSSFRKNVLKGSKAWMSKKNPLRQRNAAQLTLDRSDMRHLSEELAKKKGAGAVTAAIAWCAKGNVLNMALDISGDVFHMNRMELVWITFHQLERLTADAEFASCLARVYLLVPLGFLLEMEGEEGIDTEDVVNAILQIANDKHMIPLKDILSSSAPPDNVTYEVVTWLLENTQIWVNHAGALLEYVFVLFSRRCPEITETIARKTEMQFNHFLVNECGVNEKNDWNTAGTAGILAAACMTSKVFPTQNSYASALFPYILNYIIPSNFSSSVAPFHTAKHLYNLFPDIQDRSPQLESLYRALL